MKNSKNKSLQQFQDDKIGKLENIKKVVGGAKTNTENESSALSNGPHPSPVILGGPGL